MTGPKLGKLLIVDDEVELMSALCETLGQQNYETLGFVSAGEALAALREREFDVLLTDLMMPEMDGICLLRAALEVDPNLISILMTGRATVQTAVDAMKIGAVDYVLKPFELREILRVLSRALEVRRVKLEIVQLQEAERKYRSIVENAKEGIFQVAPSGQLLLANPAMARILGYESPEELVKADTKFPVGLSGDVELRSDNARHLDDRESSPRLESQVNRKDGSKVWVSVKTRAVRSAGALLFYEGTAEDITERKRLEDQLRKAQKMDAIGRLAGGVAHDFNNLLTVITGFSELVLARLRPDDPYRDALEEIKKAGERGAALTRQLLAFSRKQVLVPAVLDLNALVADTEKMLRRLIGEDIEMTVAPGAHLWRVKADAGQLEQVVMNLVVNARDAMPQGGKLTIETRNIELDKSYARANPETHPGEYVLLTVTDTGSGMDSATKARIFEPFFTSKGPDKGTGLGLATVFGIVKQSGGHIEVSSEPGQGTSFGIYLPQATEPILPRKSRSGVLSAPQGGETVLLVEDADPVRALARLILRDKGYRVLEARNGAEALLLAEKHEGPIHLLVTDVVMPGISGRQLYDRLAPQRPEIKVLYLSGYTDNAIVHHGVLDPDTAFLAKPFSPEALGRKVREVLDQ